MLIERQGSPQAPWQQITPEPVAGNRWFDDQVTPGHPYSYRARVVRGQRRSEPTAVQSATPRTPAESTLPVYSLTLTDPQRRALLEDPTKNVEVEGQFGFQDKSYPVKLRLHGASTRHAQKKSYRVEFAGSSPLPRPVTYLKAEPMDHTLQQEKLSCDIFGSAGAWVSQADYVNLYINGRYEGVYVDIEPIRAPFKNHPGLDPKGTLIRANTFQHLVGWEGLGELVGRSGSLEELRNFLQELNRVDEGDFEAWLRRTTDWPRVRDFLALNVICHRMEIEADDYFFYRDPTSGRWSLISWDHNNGNLGVAGYKNRVLEPSIPIFPQSIQDIGWRPYYSFVLPSRIYQCSALRNEYLERIKELTTSLLVSGQVDEMIDRNFQRLRTEYVSDPYRVPFEGQDPFLSSAADLKRFVRRHGERLLRLIQREQAREPPAIVINEFAFGPDSGWVELLNRGPQPASLAGCWLVTRDEAGNHELRLEATQDLESGRYRVIRCPRHPKAARPAETRPKARSDDEASQTGPSHAATGPGQAFPGFNPEGGFFGLARRDAESGEADHETLLDFFFYGPRKEGRSYGRLGGEFSDLTPTPGEPNRGFGTR